MKKNIIILVLLVFLSSGFLILNNVLKDRENIKNNIEVDSFEECAEVSGIVMESYPRQCRYEDKIFVENIGNELEKMDLIQIENPRPNQIISSPLNIKGQARGFWFFEADFPIILKNESGEIIAEGIAEAKNNWMTTEFVQFESTLEYNLDENLYNKKGKLILKKDNPSDIPENDDFLEVPIIFSEN
ncbi:Gmad2 immunoglobulin-like domain-containing protein [Patescibacteria group bacterium]|nr:Gmad2 immunoglobulin-like domain-containing protein [Patescibacteria group bacterium]